MATWKKADDVVIVEYWTGQIHHYRNGNHIGMLREEGFKQLQRESAMKERHKDGRDTVYVVDSDKMRRYLRSLRATRSAVLPWEYGE